MASLINGLIFYTHYRIFLISFNFFILQSAGLFALPVWTDGLELVNPLVAADFEFKSVNSTSPLIHIIVQQQVHFDASVFVSQHQAN